MPPPKPCLPRSVSLVVCGPRTLPIGTYRRSREVVVPLAVASPGHQMACINRRNVRRGALLVPGNKAVIYKGPGNVAVESIDYPTLELKDGPGVDPANVGRQIPHGVILKVVASNICGSDQHMVRGRTTAPSGLALGHEITGEVVETGRDVEFVKAGDLVSVPFNIACGRCRNCKEGKTGVCLNVNPDRPGSAYGYVDMGGWVGGQAEYALVPYADWNVLRFPDGDQALAKIRDLAMLSDIFPTGFHGAVTAGVGPGSTVYVAGAGPVGLAAATSAFLLGAAVVIVADLNKERLDQARSFGCETVDVAAAEPRDQIEQILGEPEVDAAIDAVGFEAHGHGTDAQAERPATVLNTVMDVTRAGGAVGIPGLYVTGDPGAADDAAKVGSLSIRLGLGWAKSLAFTTGQCPVMRYNRQLMKAILHDRTQIAKNVNATVIPLDQAPQGYAEFDKGAARKYVLDPHGLIT
jgi:glutathione-independent formaldehyde dehydrogenase